MHLSSGTIVFTDEIGHKIGRMASPIHIRLKCKKCGKKYNLGGACHNCGHRPIGSIGLGAICAIMLLVTIVKGIIEKIAN